MFDSEILHPVFFRDCKEVDWKTVVEPVALVGSKGVYGEVFILRDNSLVCKSFHASTDPKVEKRPDQSLRQLFENVGKSTDSALTLHQVIAMTSAEWQTHLTPPDCYTLLYTCSIAPSDFDSDVWLNVVSFMGELIVHRTIQSLARTDGMDRHFVALSDAFVAKRHGKTRGFIVMDRKRTTLSEWIRSEDYDDLKLLQIALQVCACIRWMHLHGVYHRDLKGGNIMLDNTNENLSFNLPEAFDLHSAPVVVLIDFSCSCTEEVDNYHSGSRTVRHEVCMFASCVMQQLLVHPDVKPYALRFFEDMALPRHMLEDAMRNSSVYDPIFMERHAPKRSPFTHPSMWVFKRDRV